MTDVLSQLHGATVHRRRVHKLAAHLAPLIPPDALILDVGCGDGQLGAALQHARPELRIEGVDVLVRPGTRIPARAFDGLHLPFSDRSVDVVLLVDVVHHCSDPMALLRDCGRVARQAILIKDHLADGVFAPALLRFMDFVGNAGHGVALPYNYWRLQQWMRAFTELNWTRTHWNQRLAIYPRPVDWLFGGDLHFIARMSPHPERDDASVP